MKEVIRRDVDGSEATWEWYSSSVLISWRVDMVTVDSERLVDKAVLSL